MVTNSEFEVVVLAAGLGKRMLSETPKVLHTLCNRTLLERTLSALAPLNPKTVTVVAGYGEKRVREYLALLQSQLNFPFKLKIVSQPEQRGTGHAVQLALPELIEKQVLIVPGDVPLLNFET